MGFHILVRHLYIEPGLGPCICTEPQSIWLSLNLEMASNLIMLGHQQMQCWLQNVICSVQVSLAIIHLIIFHNQTMVTPKLPRRSSEILWHWSVNRMYSLHIETRWCNLELHPGGNLLTHWGLRKMATNLQITFLKKFSWMKIVIFGLKFHWSLLLRV